MIAMADTDFAWPDFDRWQAFFAAREAFPVGWEGLQAAPPPHTPDAEAYRRRKMDLLSEWLKMLALRSTVLAHYARHGVQARIVRQHAGAACAVCDPFNAGDVGPDLDTVPPFHPGCRCVVVAARPAPVRRRSRPFERPRSRAS